MNDLTAPAQTETRASLSSPSTLRDIRLSLIGADDGRLTQIVSLLDTMANRGAADAILVPLRPRLTYLRPRRPVGFTRLLFQPLDPIIVAAPQWRRHALTIPRTALAPISGQIRTALGAVATRIAGRLEGRFLTDRAFVLECGSELWERAADILASADMPADWQPATGLSDADYMTIARAISALLRQGGAIEAMSQDIAKGQSLDTMRVRSCMTSTVEVASRTTGIVGAQAVGMLLAILLARLPNADLLITTAGDLAAALADPSARLAADKAIDFVLDGVEAGVGTPHDLAQAAEEQIRIAALLDTLEGSGPASRPVRRTRAAKLRRDADERARQRVSVELTSKVLAKVACLTRDADDADVAAIEAAARDIRRFESASRSLGGAEHYDQQLKEAARALGSSVAVSSNRVDVARVVEILQGPEAALAVLRS